MKKTIMSLATVAGLSAALTTNVYAAESVEVDPGDTLWGLSQTHGVSVADLKDWNNLDSNLIYPGDQLTVAPATTNTRVDSNSNSYTVQSGDTLWAISQRTGASVSQIKAWNDLQSNTIYPGQTLAVSGGVETKETNDVVRELEVSATAYTANCAGCSGVTATGINLLENPDKKVIAVDPDVIPLGTEVYVEGYGYAVAGDVGSAITGNKIDVFIPSRQEALNWGRKQVTVQILK
ncbi:LysM peptidoglycan-binding and 3D domain-containing protein [Pontibacillus sp. HMF3514]|uniref:LysM peptidoglycan-binding and 3D domain-containing protein n=1 Tax=Pontibacillus sp. HMF3514 TaxID=2692425 RepID=UPI0013203521|nr:3D domain-containing protein [Pontibacillus sp. HMF3514]QHE52398.1 LysM peptidoglycan-binding domain-containing protein [Pontibacillus sp. HMF3514]